MNIELFNGKARDSISKMKSGTLFVVKDLFKGHEWNELTAGEKRGYGRSFKNAVDNGQFAGIKFNKKRENNSAEYIKE